ncbi:hypothetical protein CBL_12594 [Carabus blaptoides fortunei]
MIREDYDYKKICRYRMSLKRNLVYLKAGFSVKLESALKSALTYKLVSEVCKVFM